MEGDENKQNCGLNIFSNFIKETPAEESKFDYFVLLDHISHNSLDKDLIAAIFFERNKSIEDKNTN